MTDQIPEEVKKERIYELIELQNSISAKKMQQLVGAELKCSLKELPGKKTPGGATNWLCQRTRRLWP